MSVPNSCSAISIILFYISGSIGVISVGGWGGEIKKYISSQLRDPGQPKWGTQD
ncbi:MAG: hypothetical protein F6K54_07890 [Okeania sp. SIO3B5]|nr:hypothetical protein [Okeania sp. SIO3B5]